MKYHNPVIKGFNPDPSVCEANGKYYLVTSSFQYFPGVPIFESEDLVNWKKIGHCLTRKDQIMLESVRSSGGVFAATIRFHKGTFYMVTTNNSTNQHFIVSTNDIYGEWSDPIYIDQGGIDPSLLFEGRKVYFTSNGEDDFGEYGIIQCEISIKTGKKLSPSKLIWKGSGGRYIEGPHLYKIGEYYYLFVSEGGTEYGHMMTYARSKDPYGPFEPYPNNPILTNRDLGGFEIQGVGHGDLIQDPYGNWYMIHLGFRQIDKWQPFHHLGRETFLSPVELSDEGWFTAGLDGTTQPHFDIQGEFIQKEKYIYTFENTDFNLDWNYLRHPKTNNYVFLEDSVILKGSEVSINDVGSPTFIGIRQEEFKSMISCNVEITDGEAGLTVYMDEDHHYDILIKKDNKTLYVVGRINIGTLKTEVKRIKIHSGSAKLIIVSDRMMYRLYLNTINQDNLVAVGATRYLSSEVALGFTGVMIGLYAYDINNDAEATFKDFLCNYENESISG